MAYTAIPNSMIDSDSPITETLMTYYRDNDSYFKDLFNAVTGHKHDGTTDAGGPLTNITLNSLKMATGSSTYNNPWTGDIFISMGNDYAHCPKVVCNISGNPTTLNFKLEFIGDNPSGQYWHLAATSTNDPITVSWKYHSN